MKTNPTESEVMTQFNVAIMSRNIRTKVELARITFEANDKEKRKDEKDDQEL